MTVKQVKTKLTVCGTFNTAFQCTMHYTGKKEQ